MAERIESARRDFAANLRQLGGIDIADAAKVRDYYLKERIAKLDAVSGRITVKHGAFLDREVIQRAVNLAKGN